MSWLSAAVCIHAKACGIHAKTPLQCYMLSILGFMNVAWDSNTGVAAGVVLGIIAPLFPPCNLCDFEADSSNCQEYQAERGCHACDRRGCWRSKNTCPFKIFGGTREQHADAAMGDTVPHIRQVDVRVYADGSEVASGVPRRANWWRQHRHIDVAVDGRVYQMGGASGDGCNCLIDTLKQKLGIICDVPRVRAELQKRHTRGPSRIRPHDYLELQYHWRDIIELLGRCNLIGGQKPLDSRQFKIVCVDMLYIGSGDVEGDGQRTLCIAWQNRNHFVPLLAIWDLQRHVAYRSAAGARTELGSGASANAASSTQHHDISSSSCVSQSKEDSPSDAMHTASYVAASGTLSEVNSASNAGGGGCGNPMPRVTEKVSLDIKGRGDVMLSVSQVAAAAVINLLHGTQQELSEWGALSMTTSELHEYCVTFALEACGAVKPQCAALPEIATAVDDCNEHRGELLTSAATNAFPVSKEASLGNKENIDREADDPFVARLLHMCGQCRHSATNVEKPAETSGTSWGVSDGSCGNSSAAAVRPSSSSDPFLEHLSRIAGSSEPRGELVTSAAASACPAEQARAFEVGGYAESDGLQSDPFLQHILQNASERAAKTSGSALEADGVSSGSESSSESEAEDPSWFRVRATSHESALSATEQDVALTQCAALSDKLRLRPTLPADVNDPTKSYLDTDSGIRFPLFSCPFKGCIFNKECRRALLSHITNAHAKDVADAVERPLPWMTTLDYVYGAAGVLERAQVPSVGLSITRRVLATLVKTFNDETVRCHVCFICGEQRLCWQGPDNINPSDGQFRHHAEIEFKGRQWLADAEYKHPGTLLNNCSYEVWRRRYVDGSYKRAEDRVQGSAPPVLQEHGPTGSLSFPKFSSPSVHK